MEEQDDFQALCDESLLRTQVHNHREYKSNTSSFSFLSTATSLPIFKIQNSRSFDPGVGGWRLGVRGSKKLTPTVERAVSGTTQNTATAVSHHSSHTAHSSQLKAGSELAAIFPRVTRK